jgi:hypothetical protein
MLQLGPLRPLGFACFLLASSDFAAAQTTSYVNVHGVPPGAGTQAQPYTSIHTRLDSAPVLPTRCTSGLRPDDVKP